MRNYNQEGEQMKPNEKTMSGAVLALIMGLLFSVALIKQPRLSMEEQKSGAVLAVRPEQPELSDGWGAGKVLREAAEENREGTLEETAEYTGERPGWITSYNKLNVRQSPDKEAEILGFFVYRQEIIVDGKAENGFYLSAGVDSYTGEEITGYCFGAYITFEKPGAPQVQLNVPAYYQADPRWAANKVGSTKKTMEAIGCTTTCMAMAKTYLTQTEILPDAMEDMLWYNENGDMGWPKTYERTADSDHYMEIAFEQLHKNVPVLIGAERRNGSPHWVLITGYRGDASEFKPEDFVINDPLTTQRTNLRQFLDEYPVFELIAYYKGE